MRLVGRAAALVPALLLAPDGRHARPVCVCRGDVVQVIANVTVKGVQTSGMVGEVVEDLEEQDAEEWGACCELAFGQESLTVRLRETLNGYFAYDEVEKLAGSKGFDLAEGDRVRVTADVQVKGGRNANGWEGTVSDVWEICETDPACCCAELATDAPLTVRLEAPTSSEAPAANDKGLVGYYSPEEVKVLRGAKPS